jgi:hypothetical protein
VARFGRRQDKSDETDGSDVSRDAGSDEASEASPEGSPHAPASVHPGLPSGPRDASDPDLDPEQPRINFGALLVPGVDGMQVRVDADEAGNLIAVTVMIEETAIQMSAFAAPRSGGVWDDVRTEIAQSINESGGKAHDETGRFGSELLAQVPVTQPDGSSSLEAMRFVGGDGPRWFARGLITGPGAHDRTQAGPIEDLFAGVVVDRGDHAAPPREPLVLTLPPEVAQAVDEPGTDAV